MAIRVLELHHHAVRVPTSTVDDVKRFYTDVLGLQTDQRRPDIPSIPGAWLYVGEEGKPTAQIHVMGRDSLPPFAKSEEQDPTRFHVALAVDDIEATRAELDRLGVAHWVIGGLVGPQAIQVFLEDPAGNMIELHQVGTCNCNRVGLANGA